MKGNMFLGCLLLVFVTMVTAGEEMTCERDAESSSTMGCKKEQDPRASETLPSKVPLPVISSVQVETSAQRGGAIITVRYMAPEEPDTLWLVNGLPIQGTGEDYQEVKTFSDKTGQGMTELSTTSDKRSHFAVCLHNVVAEVCAVLAAPFPDHDVLRQDLDIPWPLMTSGPLVTYEKGERLKIDAPVLDTSYNYIYTAFLYSKNPDDSQGRLVQEVSQGMEGQGQTVTISPVTKGTGWMIEVDTDHKDYEGTMIINATLFNFNKLVMGYAMFRPFSLYRRDHTAPFVEGFVAPIPNPVTWKCISGLECMVVCPFLSNGEVKVTVSGPAINSNLDLERHPNQPEEVEASIRKFGPYMGYAYVFLPNFQPEEDAGLYQCTFTTATVSVAGVVEVD